MGCGRFSVVRPLQQLFFNYRTYSLWKFGRAEMSISINNHAIVVRQLKFTDKRLTSWTIVVRQGRWTRHIQDDLKTSFARVHSGVSLIFMKTTGSPWWKIRLNTMYIFLCCANNLMDFVYSKKYASALNFLKQRKTENIYVFPTMSILKVWVSKLFHPVCLSVYLSVCVSAYFVTLVISRIN